MTKGQKLGIAVGEKVRESVKKVVEARKTEGEEIEERKTTAEKGEKSEPKGKDVKDEGEEVEKQVDSK